jgi:ubiquinone/menaquinone biosynthesis C-methylase UbiE
VEPHHPAVRADRFPVDETASRVANRRDWDAYADEYQATHGAFLGDVGFIWGPEGIPESELQVLGPVAGKDVLEVGSGASQCSRWLVSQGAWAVGLDLSHRQLQHSRRIDQESGVVVPVVEGTATHLPFADGSFDIVFSSFGALQFVADIERCVAEVWRLLRPGGRFAFSITHPTRWMFPDDPTEGGLTASQSYWDRTPYVEIADDTGAVSYVEHHRTIGDWVRLLADQGFRLLDIAEPEWPEGHERIWGGWSHIRGVLTPGTAIYVAETPA